MRFQSVLRVCDRCGKPLAVLVAGLDYIEYDACPCRRVEVAANVGREDF